MGIFVNGSSLLYGVLIDTGHKYKVFMFTIEINVRITVNIGTQVILWEILCGLYMYS